MEFNRETCRTAVLAVLPSPVVVVVDDAVEEEDALVWAPNLAGVALAAAQLALKLAFRGAKASTTAIATAAKGVG